MDNELLHYGVKGMKWGVRKKYYKDYMDNDRVIKKGQKMQNISMDERRDLSLNKPTYTSYTDHDNNAYAGYYAQSRTIYGYKPYKNTLEVTKDVKIPSQKKAVETFIEMYNKDPEGVSKSIGNAYAELDFFNGIDKIKNKNAERIANKYKNKGEEWLSTKGYLIFNQSMMATKEDKARTEYYKLLSKKGYDAISDINDVQTGYNSDDPIIFINPKKTLKNVESRQLNIDEIEIAAARYRYDEARKNRGLVDTLLYQEYSNAKKNMKRVENKYGITDSYIKNKEGIKHGIRY